MTAAHTLQSTTHTIKQLVLHEPHVIRRKAEIEQERQIALGDLQRENFFSLTDVDAGPYHVTISVVDNRMIFEVITAKDAVLEPIKLPILPFRSIIKDYFLICEGYFEAIATADAYKIEAIDMGRRGIHNEGSELLQRLLIDKVEMDFPTARRLFTLMCVLHIR